MVAFLVFGKMFRFEVACLFDHIFLLYSTQLIYVFFLKSMS